MIEALLGPALGKAAGSGAARVAGWGARQLLDERRRRKIRALLQSKAREPRLQAIAALPEDQKALLVSFCESPEMEHCATALTRAFLIEGSGKDSEKYFLDLREEFSQSLNLWMGETVSDLITAALYDAIHECVLQRITPLLNRTKLPPAVEAEIVATVGSLSAASLRNVELISSISDFNEIRIFEAQYKSQVAALHGTMRLPHAGTTKQVPYDDLFVEPKVLVDNEKEGEHADENQSSVNIDHLLSHTPRIVLLGDPGGGKSTLSRKLMYDIAADKSRLEGRVPFYVELKDYASAVRGRSKRTLVEYLEEECKSPYNLEAPPEAIEYLLLNNRAVVILDGLDELLDVSLRRDVVQAVEGFAHRFPMCPMLVTSRRVGYFEAALSDSLFTRVGLGQFSGTQVRDYVKKWFTLDESVEHARQEQLANSFVSDSEFVQDLRVNPLMLSLMCGIYASENYIPRNRPDVYEKCALLLFERWDKQRGIVPELSFDAHVQSALRALALHIFQTESTTSDPGEESRPKEGMRHHELVDFLKSYLRQKRFDNDEDAETAAIGFLDFCKGRAWVLTDIGAETYGFTHRTFLEYFAASQLVRLHTSAPVLYKELREQLRAGEADVVAQLAVQILGKTTEDGADDFLELAIQDAREDSDQDANLISFAARALNFIVPRPDVLRAICESAINSYLDPVRKDEQTLEAVDYLFRCSAENAPRIGTAIREVFDELYGDGPAPERAIYLLFSRQQKVYSDRPYWNTWVVENLALFKSTLEAVRSVNAWSALVEYEAGIISLSDLLEMHGPRVLYAYSMGQITEGPPFVYRFLVFRIGSGYLGYNQLISQVRMKQIATDLLHYLPMMKQPWLRQEAGHEVTLWAFHHRGRMANVIKAARTLLALPVLELEIPSTELLPMQEFQQHLSARERKSVPRDLRKELTEQLSDYPNALNLAISWCQEKATLLGPAEGEL